MLDLEPVNIICHNRRDSSTYSAIIEILDMYELDGLNYKIWTSFEKGKFSQSNRSICYSLVEVSGNRDINFKLNSGNLFRLDVLVWELPTTIHPIYIRKYLEIIRESFDGTIIFVGENIDSEHVSILNTVQYPIYFIKKIDRKTKGFRTLADLRKSVQEESNTIEDRSGNTQTIGSWKTTFIRDRKETF